MTRVSRYLRIVALCGLILLAAADFAHAQSEAGKKSIWQSVEFGIVKLNDAAPISWNIYHGDKKGVLLVRLWKRYLLIRVQDEEAYDIDPQKITVKGNGVEWSPLADVPDKPIDAPEWKDRNVGLVERIRFRLGKDGHFLEVQIPVAANGRPLY